MKLSLRSVSKFGILICLTYVMWYKWVYGDHVLILYMAAFIATLGMLFSFLRNTVNLSEIFPYGCMNDIVMCAYSLITGLLVAQSQNILFSTVGTYFAFSCVCLAFCFASKETGYDWLLKSFIAIALVCSLWTLTHGYYLRGYGYVLSPTNNPHTLGYVMDLALFAVAYRSKNTIKSFYGSLLLTGLFLYMIIQCGSRKCLLAAIFIVLPWLWSEIKEIMKTGTTGQKLVAIVLLLIIICGGSYYYSTQFVNSTAYSRMAYIEESSANKARVSYYKLGFEFFKDSPILGIGLGQFALMNPDSAYSHSTIIEALSSWGIIGFIMYFAPIISVTIKCIKLANRRRDKESVMIAALCLMELFLAFMQIYFYSMQHMIAWAIIYIHYKQISREEYFEVT